MSLEGIGSARLPGRVWSIGLLTGTGAMLVMLDATLAGLALVSIQAELDAPVAQAHWVVSSYLIAIAVSLPASAWFGARFGHGRLWGIAMLAFVAASLGCAFANGLDALIVSRIAQGLAAGIMLPSGQAMLVGAADRDQLGRVFGVVGTLISLATAIGPGLGGWLIEVGSWRSLFWINVPLGAIAAACAAKVMPSGEARRDIRLPVGQLLLIVVGLPMALYGASQVVVRHPCEQGWAALGGGLALLCVFVAIARASSSPLVAVQLLRNRQFRVSSWLGVSNSANLFGGLVLFPLYFHAGQGMSHAQIGAMLMFMGAGTASSLYLAGKFVDRRGPRPAVLAGAAMLTASALPFALASVPATVAATLMFVRGIGLAWTQNPAITAAYAAVDRRDIGAAATLINIVQRVSGALGAVAIAATISWFSDGEGLQGVVGAMGLMVILPVLQAWSGARLVDGGGTREAK